MTVADDVTKEMVLGLIDWTLDDIAKEQKEAQAAYEKDNSDEFSHALATAFQLAAEMLRNRLSSLQDEGTVCQ